MYGVGVNDVLMSSELKPKLLVYLGAFVGRVWGKIHLEAKCWPCNLGFGEKTWNNTCGGLLNLGLASETERGGTKNGENKGGTSLRALLVQ